MAFKKGDILQIVNREDPNWWQVSLPSQTVFDRTLNFQFSKFNFELIHARHVT